MPVETNLNRVPYFDDFDPDNDYYRILFRPGTAVQARELTQMQSIAQHQIESFGKHVFKEGSVVDGCDITFNDKINYLKLTDNYQNGAVVSTIDLEGKYLLSTSNLYSYVTSSYEGSEGSSPDLKTLYIKYTNSGTYSNGTQQKIYNSDDILTVLTGANVEFGIITVANSSVSPTGNSYVATVTDGVIFHKGTFIRVGTQTTVVSKYNTNPNNVSVGFTTVEDIITPEIDVSLNDNSQGSSNYNAPGAHRLRLLPTLTVRTTDNEDSSNTLNFFSITDFVDGKATRILTDPQYASLGTELARRTYEESGNYVVKPFVVTTNEKYNNNSSNTTHLNTVIDKGVAYIQGYRVEYSNKVNVPVRKGNDIEYVGSQTIRGNFGNYVYVKEFSGVFDVNQLTGSGVSLYDTAQTSVTNGQLSGGTVQGSLIGTANIRSIIYYSGTPGLSTAQYKVYLFNIKMNSAKTFSEVKSIYINSSYGKAFADLVLESSLAVLKEANLSNLVIPLGKRAVRNLRNAESAPDDYVTQYNFRSSNNFTFTQSSGSVGTLNIPTTGVGTSGQELPYSGGILSSTNELDFIVVATSSANTANLNGTISTSGVTVTGTGTFFANTASTLYLEAGDFVYVVNSTASELKQIASVNSNVSITVNSAFVGTFPGGAKILRHIPTGSVVNLTKPTANITVVDTSSANIYIGTTLNKDLTATAYYNLRRETAVGMSKVINKNRYVKIDLSTSNTTGPWSLGLPDVHKLRGVYQGNSTVTYGEYSTSNRNILSAFTLDDGQKDDSYDLAKIYLNPGHTFNTTDRFLVELDHFTHNKSSGVGFLSVESYPIDDANTSNTTAITTQEIPFFTGSNGIKLDLRDCIDYRPIKANTANSASTTNTATINPSNTSSFDVASGGAYAFTPDEEFTTDFSYYVGRIDKLYIDTRGNVGVKEGSPAINPRTPSDKQDSMNLATLDIPPYPSLPYNLGIFYKRPDYTVNMSIQQTKRFTMKDIGVLEDRVNRLEYYTTLSLLESNTKNLKVLDGSGNDRFKNGFLVDSFNDVSIADTDNVEFQNYSPGFDFNSSEIVPRQMVNWIDLMQQTLSANVVTYETDSNNKNGIPNKITMLNASATVFFSQPTASKKRTISEGNVFTYKGLLSLDPPGNHKIDVTTNPALTAQLSALGNIKVVNHVLVGNSYRVEDSFNGLDSNLSVEIVPGVASSTFSTGNFIQDININPYLSPNLVKFTCFGMKPNTIIYPFFDNVLVSIFCRQTNSSFVPTGEYGRTLTTDSSGSIYGEFYIPKGIFLSGDRIFKLIDTSNAVTSADTVTTEASTLYFGSNISITRASLNIQTQQYDINLISTLTKPTVIPPVYTNVTVNNITDQYYITNVNVTPDQQGDYQHTGTYSPPTVTPEIQNIATAQVGVDNSFTIPSIFPPLYPWGTSSETIYQEEPPTAPVEENVYYPQLIDNTGESNGTQYMRVNITGSNDGWVNVAIPAGETVSTDPLAWVNYADGYALPTNPSDYLGVSSEG
ncbi:MAG: DUF4815 domain-containing protein [Candidatus Levybacteria bacterium]|nr:DUF4815 domain-containing protein [Candidatus Levybacteria bacterium]